MAAQSIDRWRQPLVAAGAEHQRRPGLRETFSHFFAKATRTAGDNGDAAGKFEQILDGRHMRPHIVSADRTSATRRLEDAVAQVQEAIGGGTFLTRALAAEDLFTRDDLTDEQRLFGQTAAEFMKNEVLPNEAAAVRPRLDADAAAAEEGGGARPAAAGNP